MNKLWSIVNSQWSIVIVILIIAAFLRLYNITETPPGFYPDEAIYANNGVEAWETAPPAGGLKVFYPENNGREGLWPNIIGFFIVKFGHEPWVPRSIAAIFGILTVLGVYFLTRELFRENPKSDPPAGGLNPKQYQNSNVQNNSKSVILNPPKADEESPRSFASLRMTIGALIRISHGEKIALLSSFFLAVSFWHINFSRIGFRAIMAPFFLTWGVYFLLASLNKLKFTAPVNQNNQFPVQSTGQRIMFFSALGGIFYGLGFHSYIAYRATPILILIIFVIYWQIIKKKQLGQPSISPVQSTAPLNLKIKKKFFSIAVLFSLSAMVAFAPLGLYFVKNPQDFFGRTTQISIFNSPAPLKNLAENVLKTAGMFNFSGDWNWRHNVAGRSLLVWPVGILFVIGIILGLSNIFRNSKHEAPGLDSPSRRGGRNSKQYLNSKFKCSKHVFGILNFGHLNLFRASDFGFRILFTWLIITALPVVISNEGLPHALRAILMAPAVFILAGIGGVWFYEFIKLSILRTSDVRNIDNGNLGISDVQKLNRTKVRKTFLFSLSSFLLLLLIIDAYISYFILWGKNPNTADVFNQEYVRLGKELRDLPKELPKYVVVEASGVDVRGMPMPTQTVMFITDTFTPEKQKAKNLYYIFPNALDKIDQEKSYVVYLK